MLEQLSSVFFDEANELLDNLEEQLLALSDNPGDSETIAAVFRAMHTIKGSSAMFGFNEISSFTHEAESAMDQVRNGIIPVTPELITLLLKARDHIRSLLDAGMEVAPEIHQLSENLILEIGHDGNHIAFIILDHVAFVMLLAMFVQKEGVLDGCEGAEGNECISD